MSGNVSPEEISMEILLTNYLKLDKTTIKELCSQVLPHMIKSGSDRQFGYILDIESF